MAFVAPVLPGDTRRLEQEKPVIEVSDLIKTFGSVTAIRDVSFSVPKGAIFGFIGPSGSGKTTTVRAVTGVYPPTEGSVLVFGEPPTKFNQQMRARLGYMPQLFVLYPNLTVWENMNFAASLYGMSLRREKQLREVLEFVELYEHKNKVTRNTSGGMQRRLSLAATLVHKPELIFLDEPTAGIDPILRQKFWDHFKELQAEGRTLFITTQYVNEAAYCDLVGVMADGKLLTVDTPKGLRYQAYKGEMVDVTIKGAMDYLVEGKLRDLPVVTRIMERLGPNSSRLLVNEAKTAIPEIMDWSQSQDFEIEAIEEHLPPFEDVFVELVRGDGGNA